MTISAFKFGNDDSSIIDLLNSKNYDVIGLDQSKDMISQGNKINKWGKNVYVKVPVTNSKGKFMGAAINTLNKNKVKLNITAVYTATQTKKILSKIDKKTKVIISIFGGRMGDVGKDPVPEFKKSLQILAKNSHVLLYPQPLKYLMNPRYFIEFSQSL